MNCLFQKATMHQRSTVQDGIYAIADYSAQSLGMLLVAPYLLNSKTAGFSEPTILNAWESS
jgi:hypothetical protein